MAIEVRKTEHAGAKNGGGFWGLRVDAKIGSNKIRRLNDRLTADEGVADTERLPG